MWMLERANSLSAAPTMPDGSRVLAANPDSAERGDPWRWSITLHTSPDGVSTSVKTDESFVVHTVELLDATHCSTVLTRCTGDVIVVAVKTGEALITVPDGPWQRRIHPGDSFVLEGEVNETIRVELTDTQSTATVYCLTPTRTAALRWVP